MWAVMLTKKQKELLDYLTTHAEKHDVPPSFDEMRDALGLASKSGIHRLVSGLEERGYIRRLANRARAIEILKPVNAAADAIGRGVTAAANSVSLPLLGRIAAGTPIEALSDPRDQRESKIWHFELYFKHDFECTASVLIWVTTCSNLVGSTYH